MRITPISIFTQNREYSNKQRNKFPITSDSLPVLDRKQIYTRYSSPVSFKSRLMTKTVEFEDYMEMLPEEKEYYRKLYERYYDYVDKNELHNSNVNVSWLPLRMDRDMDDFIRVSSVYNNYKDNHIVCVGRSPKWFLNTSIWMKDGIEDYSFNAFSSNWYSRNQLGLGPNLTLDESRMPTLSEYAEYRDYLKKQKTDPISIIKKAEKTGKPVIVTDYIHSGCGLTSYLDLMSEYAQNEGVLDDYAKSIELLTLSSIEYITDDFYLGQYLPTATPIVLLPPRLVSYNIKQRYVDMSPEVLKDILINKNTNECRSSYYPHNAWTVYSPAVYKTGMLSDTIIKNMEKRVKGFVNNYTNAMRDYRNLMNFRILDGLNQRNLLKKVHITR